MNQSTKMIILIGWLAVSIGFIFSPLNVFHSYMSHILLKNVMFKVFIMLQKKYTKEYFSQ